MMIARAEERAADCRPYNRKDIITSHKAGKARSGRQAATLIQRFFAVAWNDYEK